MTKHLMYKNPRDKHMFLKEKNIYAPIHGEMIFPLLQCAVYVYVE